jgi:hypothetical protein
MKSEFLEIEVCIATQMNFTKIYIHGGKGEGWHVEEYSVALLC